MEKKEMPFGKKVAIVTAVAGFLFLLLVILVLSSSDSSGEYKVDEIAACVFGQSFVEDKLKSPSTAEFEPCYKSIVTYTGNQTYRIKSYVDSSNDFGAIVRTDFIVTVQDELDGWILIDLKFI